MLFHSKCIPQMEEELTKAYDDKQGFTIESLENDLITCVGEYMEQTHEATFSIDQERKFYNQCDEFSLISID